MANVYVRSGAGGAGTGADWANAYTHLATALNAKAAGDIFYVSEDHAETQASGVTLSPPGTSSNPNKILCVNHSGSVPPVSADLATTATVSCTGQNSFQFGNGYAYYYGITFKCGSGGSQVNTAIGGGSVSDQGLEFEACCLDMSPLTNGYASFQIGAGGNSQPFTIILTNTTFKFGNVGQAILLSGAGKFRWRNTLSAIGGSTFPTYLFGAYQAVHADIECDGVDFSALGSGKTLMKAINGPFARFVLNNCKLNASVTVAATPTSTPSKAIVAISDSGAHNYRQEIYEFHGNLTTETTDIRAGGASDGTTGLAWKVITNANNNWMQPFECFQLAEWNATVGSPITLYVHIMNDGTTLTNADIWVEFQYMNSAGTPIAARASSGVADQLAAAANVPTDSISTWTTTGITTPIKQVMSATFTPQFAGYVRAVVKIAKASKTIYVDPQITTSA